MLRSFLLAALCPAFVSLAQDNIAAVQLSAGAASNFSCSAIPSIAGSPGPRDDVEAVHKALRSTYLSTNGDRWTSNSG